MYEGQTEEVIEKRMLSVMSNAIDKREGSIAYDATMPAAIEFMLLYAALDYFMTNTFGDTADREHLIERAKERGLEPYEATYAYVTIEATPADVVLPTGSRFSVDELNYVITKRVTADGNQYLARCENPGLRAIRSAAGQSLLIMWLDYSPPTSLMLSCLVKTKKRQKPFGKGILKASKHRHTVGTSLTTRKR